MTRILSVRLLGDYRLAYGDSPVTSVNTDRLQSLLAYLILHRAAPVSRRQLADLLWPESPEAQARSNLRNLLFQLRQALPDADCFIAADTSTLQWRGDSPFALDVAQFTQALDAAIAAQRAGDLAQARRYLEEAAGVYGGDLLPGNYDDWLMPLREELRLRYMDALSAWVQLLEEMGDLRAAVRVAQRIVQQDLLDEAAYAALMRLYALLGDRAGVQRVYENCVAALARELDVEPSPATQTAYQQAMAQAATQPAQTAALAASPAAGAPVPAMPAPIPSAPPRPRLPVAATPFVGRERELAELAELLNRPDVRLVSIVGPGGIGKTRLALQTALGHQTVYASGVVFVPLAGVTAPHLIAPAIAETLGLSLSAGSGLAGQLYAALQPREMLLVIDNVEQLLDGIDILAELLAQAPRLKLLVTSRERLNLQEEWVFDLHGLPVPHGEFDFAENTAVALFALHARRARSDFVVEAHDHAALIRICLLVEGMPLALELAASWVRLLTCQEIAAEIAASLDFLSVARRNVPDRHRSIRAVFEHSWSLLTPVEQEVFMRLTVFRGGFDREAVEQVAQATLPVLSTLVDKSLVRRVTANRYDVHELLRQFAWEKLQARGELGPVQTLHLYHYLSLAETADPQLSERDQVKWIRRLEQESDNLQAAFDYARAQQDVGRAMRLVAALWRYWLLHGDMGERRRFVQELLAQRDQVPASVLSRFLYAAGSIAYYQQEIGPAVRCFQECVELERGGGSPAGIALAVNRLGMALHEQNDYDQALVYYQEALAIYRRLGDDSGISRALMHLGTLEYDLGRVAEALPYFEQSLASAQRRGDQDTMATALVNLSWMAVLDHQSRGLDYGLEAVALFRELNSLFGLAYAFVGIAGALACRRPEDAARIFGAAQQLFETVQSPLSAVNQGYVERMMAPARRHLGEESFRQAVAAGRTMPLAGVLALVDGLKQTG